MIYASATSMAYTPTVTVDVPTPTAQDPYSAPVGMDGIQSADWTQAGGLDAQALLTYCTSRLNTIDALIQSRFGEQQKRNDAIKEAGALIDTLNAWPSMDDKSNANFDRDHQWMAQHLTDLYKNTTDPTVRAKIAEVYGMVTGGNSIGTMNVDGSYAVNSDQVNGQNDQQWQTTISGVKSVQDDLSKDNELSMISLQSIVSQRQLAVQLTTQMMQSLFDGYKQVTSNIRVG